MEWTQPSESKFKFIGVSGTLGIVVKRQVDKVVEAVKSFWASSGSGGSSGSGDSSGTPVDSALFPCNSVVSVTILRCSR